MLQQTQVETVIPYFQRFIQRFPDLPSLAMAEESEVLQVWEGLGYYSRARNLHKAARMIVADYAGQIPADVAALKSLPGIGACTAGAIASIAFGFPEPALDANIRRVTIRLLDLHEPPGSKTDAKLWEFARQILPASRIKAISASDLRLILASTPNILFYSFQNILSNLFDFLRPINFD
jgi:A/G-specific adenine glycosylase